MNTEKKPCLSLEVECPHCGKKIFIEITKRGIKDLAKAVKQSYEPYPLIEMRVVKE